MGGCEQYAELIQGAVDGALDEAALRVLEEHLAVCEDCRRLYTAMEAVSQAVRDSALEPPKTLKTAVMRGVAARRRRSRSRLTRGLALAACLALVAVAALRFGGLWGTGAGNSSASAGASYSVSDSVKNSGSAAGAALAPTQGPEPFSAASPAPSAQPEDNATGQTAPSEQPLPDGTESGEKPDQSGLLGITGSSLYQNTGSGLYELLLRNLDDGGVNALMAFLDLRETGDFSPAGLEPSYVLAVRRPYQGVVRWDFWVFDDKLFCDSSDGAAYYEAGCDPAAFSAFVEDLAQ